MYNNIGSSIYFIMMEQNKHNYYLYNCICNRDIENNIGEVKIPEFTMEHIIAIDEQYKTNFEQVNEIVYQDQDISDEQQIMQMTNKLEINELFTEHIQNIEVLIIRMNEYNTIRHRLMSKHNLTTEEQMQEDMFIRSKQIQLYFGHILPVIQLDKANLHSILALFIA